MHSQGLRLTLAGFYEYYCITYRRALGIAVPEDDVCLKDSLLLLFLLKPCKIPLFHNFGGSVTFTMSRISRHPSKHSRVTLSHISVQPNMRFGIECCGYGTARHG